MSEQTALYEALRTDFAQRSGFYMADNDDLAVRLWAVAAQLATLYTVADWNDRQAFPQTAEGQQLDYHGQMRGLSRRDGTRAQGVLRMFLEEPLSDAVSIPAGTICTDAGLVRFVTLEDGEIPAGETYTDIPAQAEQPGVSGNAEPGTIRFWTRAPVAVSSVTNPAAFTGGLDPEDDASFRARILDSYHRLPNGANAAWYEARTLAIEGVAAVSVLPRCEGIGTVGVVVAAGDGPADETLLAQVSEVLQSAREIATDVIVSAPETVTVPVSVQVAIEPGRDAGAVLLAVRTAIEQFFTGELLGKPLYQAALGRCIYQVTGVMNYRLLSPATDVTITASQLPVLGTLSVEEMAI